MLHQAPPMSLNHQPEPESPELSAFLLGAILRRLQGKERRTMLHGLFAEAARPKADAFDPQYKPARIMVMWRIVRTTAIVKGLCSEDETLDTATELDPDPWTNPFMPILSAAAGVALRRARGNQLLRQHATAPGLPLLPPRADPPALERWCTAASIIAADLGVERSREGLLGLQGLLDPHQCARCDVSSAEVLAFEELLLQESLDILLEHGERAALKHFKIEYCFTHREATGLLRIVKTQALERSGSSIEEKRALQEMRLEDYISRSKDSLDMDGEMKGIKELAKIQGLTRTEPEDQAAEFFAVVKKVSKRQDQERLDPATIRLLDGNRAEEVEATIIEVTPVVADPDDAEALAEFDTENQHR